MYQTAFIVGAPRSGTTLLGDILDNHPSISCWNEPYFIMDRFFKGSEDDKLTANHAQANIAKYIKTSFAFYAKKTRCRIIVDKSPRNSLRLPFLRAVFPDSKFIHVLRDGRDSTLSINKSWEKQMLSAKGFSAIKNSLIRQKYIRHKIMLILFHLNHRSRWGKRRGWGPRFPGWKSMIKQKSLVEFNALQWQSCVNHVLRDFPKEISDHFMEIRYEYLIQNPQRSAKRVFDFLGIFYPKGFMNTLPVIHSTNFGKWEKGFSDWEKRKIYPILTPLLLRLGYIHSERWC